jgi:aryl-alcohol dehydrogenase-like predicted oxidoreductase
VRAGKVRSIGLSNETPYGVHEFVRVAEQFDLPRIATVQNPYALSSRGLDNGLDETLHRLGGSLIPYSPLGFGLLTASTTSGGPGRPAARSRSSTHAQQRWAPARGLAARAPLQRAGARHA